MRAGVISGFLTLLFIAGFTRAADDDSHVLLITVDGFAAFYLDDPAAPIPTIRKLAAEGAVAEGMRVVNPAVTWPNHTTLVTGVRPATHSVLFNGVLTRPGPGKPVKVDPAREQADLVAVPLMFDHLKKAGLSSAAINWPCTRGSASIEDNFPDVPDQIKHTTPRLIEELAAKGAFGGDDPAKAWAKMNVAGRDQVWTEAACHVIRTRKPRFMTLHLLTTDAVQHRYGPKTPAAYAALALADAHLKEVLRALDEAGIREKTTVIVTADHGFETAGRLILPNVAFNAADLLKAGPAGIVQANAQTISEGGIAMLYLTNPETIDADRAKVLETLKDQIGIAEVLPPEKFATYGLPTPDKNRQAPDLILVAQPLYAFSNTPAADAIIIATDPKLGTIGHHGYLSTTPTMNAAFIASGRGVKRGTKLGVIENIDVAPTMAKLLGQELPGAEGKVMEGMLEK